MDLQCILGRRLPSPPQCTFHGDITGKPSVYALYDDHHHDDPSLDGPGPRLGGRWGCCQDTDAAADGCKVGWHVGYAGATADRAAVRLARAG